MYDIWRIMKGPLSVRNYWVDRRVDPIRDFHIDKPLKPEKSLSDKSMELARPNLELFNSMHYEDSLPLAAAPTPLKSFSFISPASKPVSSSLVILLLSLTIFSSCVSLLLLTGPGLMAVN